MDNCTDTTSHTELAISAMVIELIISLFGAIGSGLSLYCLQACKKIQEGMKIHLCLLFSMSLVTCCLPLPGNAVVEHGKLLGWDIDRNVTKGFVACYTIFAVLDRNIHAVLAVYRMIVVLFPFRHNAISRKAVSIAAEVIVCVIMTSLWITDFVLKGSDPNSAIDPSRTKLGYILYCIKIAPITITAIAYIILVLYMASKRRNLAEFMTRSEKDQPTMSVTILILINIALDVPHIILHLMRICPAEISFVVIHIIYRLHFALDPFIFIGLNRRYRQMVLRKISSVVPVVSVSVSPHACGEGTSGTTQVQTETQVQKMPTGTP